MCADAQAGLRLCCSQTPEDSFSCIEVHVLYSYGKRFQFLVWPKPLGKRTLSNAMLAERRDSMYAVLFEAFAYLLAPISGKL